MTCGAYGVRSGEHSVYNMGSGRKSLSLHLLAEDTDGFLGSCIPMHLAGYDILHIDASHDYWYFTICHMGAIQIKKILMTGVLIRNLVMCNTVYVSIFPSSHPLIPHQTSTFLTISSPSLLISSPYSQPMHSPSQSPSTT